ncbi:MAG: DsbA family protein [Candidatus Yonathbacteria bacterium]|nr:DsbA family protein [Candidatus Yonathbacteria bacterium]
MDTQKRIIVWVSVILVVGITIFAIWNVATSPAETPSRNNQGLLMEQVNNTDWTKGSKNPKVTLVEYGDFQCPACGAYYPVVEKVLEEYKDRLSFTYRHFPLPQHKNALNASYAAEAAGKQGKFWEMYTMIFEHQSDWSEETNAGKTFEGYAKSLNLDMIQFATDVNSSTTKDSVAHDKETGLSAGVNSTPSFYLNGKRMQNPRGYEELKALIEYALIHG